MQCSIALDMMPVRIQTKCKMNETVTQMIVIVFVAKKKELEKNI